MPATLPRLRNCCWRTIASALKLLSGLQGVQPMGKTPASDLPLGDLAIAPAAKALLPPMERAASDTPAPCRNVRRFLVISGPFFLDVFKRPFFLAFFLKNPAAPLLAPELDPF